MKKKNIVQLFRILISVLFVFSAISKIVSLPFFDALVAKLLVGKDYYEQPGAYLFIQLFTRLIIAGELLLGVAVLQRKYLKKIILPTIFGILLMFTAHLFYEGFTDKFIGGNCGCFGDVVPLDNFQSIIKNFIAMFLVWYVWKNYTSKGEMRFRSWVFSVVVGTVTLGTLLLTVKNVGQKVELKDYQNTYDEVFENPIIDSTAVTKIDSSLVEDTVSVTTEIEQEKVVEKPKEGKQIKPVEKAKPKVRTVLSDYSKFTGASTPVDLDKGRKMVCMFSLTCGHCQEAYKNICQMADQGGFPPIYLLLYGDSEDQITYFFNQAGCKHPYIFVQDYIAFERVLEGKNFPRILDRVDGVNKKEWDLDSYSKESLAAYFGLEVPEEEDNGLGF